MQGNFIACHALSRVSEGGYVNHPEDNGGATNYGVTQRTYDAYRRETKQALQDVKLIQQYEVHAIYLKGYWEPVNGDGLPKGLDYAVFDCALTAGPRRAAKFLQRLVGVTQDGKIGAVTLTKVSDYVAAHGHAKLIRSYCDARLAHMKGLSDWQHFGKGWASRVERVYADAVKMAG